MSPSGYLTGPSGYLTGPSGGLTGPSGNLTGPFGDLTGPSGNLTGPSGNLNGPTGDSDDQDHGEDDGVDDYNLHANQSETRILVGQTPTSSHPVLPSEQLGRQVGRRFFKPVCFVSFP